MLGDIENAAEEEDANEDLFAMGARMLGNIESDAEEEMSMTKLFTWGARILCDIIAKLEIKAEEEDANEETFCLRSPHARWHRE